MDLKEALSQLEPENDEHWTGNGDPRLDVLSEMVGEKVARKDVTDAAPQFTRDNPVLPGQEPAEKPDEPKEDAAEPQAKEPAEEAVDVKGESEAVTPDVMKLRDERAKLQSEFAKLGDQIAAAKNRQTEIHTELDLIEQRLQGHVPHKSNQEAIQAYIKSQNEQRLARAQRRAKILEHLDPKDIQAKAPIDQAMARKTQRGGQRPQMPLKDV